MRRIVALLVLALALAAPAAGAAATGTVEFVDVGQGDGVVVKVGGRVIVSDAGERWAGPRMAAALRALGAKRIDVAILSHAHDDHIGGFLPLVKQFPIGLVVYSENRHYNLTKTNRELFAALGQAQVPLRLVAAGDRFRWGGASWRILGPPESEFVADEDAADASVAYLLTTNGVRLLFTGDVEQKGSHLLAQGWRYGRVDVFLATHHGSAVGSPQELLARIRPRFAILSTGPNGFGHPTPATVGRLEAVGATIWCTDVNGNVTATLSAGRITWSTSGQAQPWWTPEAGETGRCVGR